jgi:glycine cleavage system transcriptional repressor
VNKCVVFVLGPDGPGIIAAVAGTLFARGCNLEDVSQTTLQGEFVGIFIAALPPGLAEESLLAALRERLAGTGLVAHLRRIEEAPAAVPAASEPFVITTVGPDRPGLVAGIAELLAARGANITNLKAVTRGGDGRQDFVTFYEVDLPAATDLAAFRAALGARARELGLDVNLQHREIFEQVHRV